MRNGEPSVDPGGVSLGKPADDPGGGEGEPSG